MAGDKTEKPTPRRREKALEEGNVFAPKELGAAGSLGVACLFLALAGPALWADLLGFLADSLGGAASGADTGNARALLRRLPVLWPLLLFAGMAVTGFG
ncbi:MAG: EscU/YscU/HrcU family type III secretion system export apparatus switch protein, partial [Sandarakinorhabdus sp.]